MFVGARISAHSSRAFSHNNILVVHPAFTYMSHNVDVGSTNDTPHHIYIWIYSSGAFLHDNILVVHPAFTYI